MPAQTNLIIPENNAALLAEIVRRYPDWNVASLEVAERDPQLPGPCWIFIDWIGEAMSGIERCRRLRENGSTRTSHITMVFDEADSDERRRALKAGADDYLIGPLTADRLLDRMTMYGLADGTTVPARSRLSCGELTVDLSAHQLRHRGAPVPLRPNEFNLLVHFMEHPDQVFSRTALIDRLGKNDEAIDERTVDVWVGRLRRSLAQHGAPDPLRTVRAMGYVLDSSS